MVTKNNVLEFLKEVEVDDLVRNLQVMGNSVILDMVSHSPAMHEKKKLELAMKSAFEQKFGEKIQLKLNILVEVPEKPQIKGTPIPGVQNIIAISSGKGGVGKSTISANIALTLQQMGFKVGLLDTDIYGPSIPTMFDVENAKPLSVEVDGKHKMKPIESYGIKLLSIGFFAGTSQAVVWRGPMATKALNQMIRDAHWGELDFLLLDLPPGTGDIHLSIVQELPVTGAVVVSTPQTIALADVKKGVGMFQMESINVPVLGIIENMSYFTPEELPNNKYYIFGKEGAKNLSEKLEVPFLGEVPIIQSIREGADVGRPAVLQENGIAKNVFVEITKSMIEQVIERNTNLPATEAVKITTMAGCSPKVKERI